MQNFINELDRFDTELFQRLGRPQCMKNFSLSSVPTKEEITKAIYYDLVEFSKKIVRRKTLTLDDVLQNSKSTGDLPGFKSDLHTSY